MDPGRAAARSGSSGHIGSSAYRILGLITWIILTLFLIRGARIALGARRVPRRPGRPSRPRSSHLFTWMSDGLAARSSTWSFLWAHLALVLGFLVYLAYSKHLHIITSAINVFFASTRPRGALEPLRIDMERLESGRAVARAPQTLTDLTRKELLDLYACTECGRCQSVCPAWNTGKPLSPKLLIMNLRDHLFEEGPNVLCRRWPPARRPRQIALVPGIIDDEVVWACTTCGACVQECPVDIEHVDTIVDLRRNLVMGESRFPAEAGAMLRNLESRSNPWGVAAVAARRLGRRAGRAGRERRGARVPVLGRLRRLLRRPSEEDLPRRGRAAAAGRGLVRDPRPA